MYLEYFPKESLSRATGREIALGPISDVLLRGGPEDSFAYAVGPARKFWILGSGLLRLETYYKQHGEEYDGTYLAYLGTCQIFPSRRASLSDPCLLL